MSDPENQPLLVAMVVAVDLETKTLKIAVPLATDQQESMAGRLLSVVVQNLPYITAEADSATPAPEWVH